MKKFSAFAVTSLFAVSAPVFADSANHQLDVNYVNIESSYRGFGTTGEIDLYTVGYGYFFQGLDLEKGPLAEAEFLSRSSSIQGLIAGGLRSQ